MGKPWKFSGDRCPECSGLMILNHVGHECGSINCDYIEKVDQLNVIVEDLEE